MIKQYASEGPEDEAFGSLEQEDKESASETTSPAST